MCEISTLNKTIISVSIIVLYVCVVIYPAYEFLNFEIPYETELAKCPACLGNNMCDCFTNNKFRLNWDHFWTNLLNIVFNKSVIFGMCGHRKVVLKRMGIDTPNVKSDKNFTEEDVSIESFMVLLKKLPRLNRSYPLQDFVLCPSSERLDILLKPVIERNYELSKNKLTSKGDIYQNIFYTFQVNVEPLIQQMTRFWSTARYLGACGDIAVSEYGGTTLTWVFPKLSWDQRAPIAQQLLNFAHQATFDNPEFAFYFTDLSPDNWAVMEGNLALLLVDLDNVIVVDKNVTDQPDDWDVLHECHHDENIRGFAFSTDEICAHRSSDVNIYSICLGILSAHSELLQGGLLHSPPQHMSGLQELLEDCVSPPEGVTRFTIGYKMLNVLDLNNSIFGKENKLRN